MHLRRLFLFLLIAFFRAIEPVAEILPASAAEEFHLALELELLVGGDNFPSSATRAFALFHAVSPNHDELYSIPESAVKFFPRGGRPRGAARGAEFG
jgi:hypothetical protein